MTAPPMMNGQPPGPPTLPDGTQPIDPHLVTNAIFNALKQGAAAAAASSGQDYKDFMAGILSGAQAIVILDPSLAQGGTPLQHDVVLKQMDNQNQQAIAQIQAGTQIQIAKHNADAASKRATAAPTPARRKNVTVQRDQHGRASSYSMSES